MGTICRKPPRRVLHLTWIALVAICAIGVLLIWTHMASRARRQNQLVSAVQGAGGDALYSSQVTYVLLDWPFPPAGPTWSLNCEPLGIRGWLASWIDLSWVDSIASVRLSGTSVSGDVLAEIGRMPDLQYLDLMSAEFKGEELEFLRDCHSLKYLSLWGTRIGDDDLAFLHHMAALEELDLSRTGITDQGLEQLTHLPNLRRLWLDDTPVTSAGLATLRRCVHLEQLGLSGTNVDDDGLPHLAAMAKLQILDLQRTLMTQPAVDALRSTRPLCQVFFERTESSHFVPMEAD